MRTADREVGEVKAGGAPLTSITRVSADIALVAIAGTMLVVSLGKGQQHAATLASRAEAPADWRSHISDGMRWGPSTAPITIVEFMDFQCPFCARWALRVDSLLAEYPDAVEVVTYHFPLTSHEFAVTAAVAVECADRQNEARAYQQVLLRDQHLIGTRPWEEFAREAGVADLDTFSVCVLLPADSFPRIAQGRMWGEKSGVRGTPTVWVNGEVHTPTLAQLRGMVERESAKGRH